MSRPPLFIGGMGGSGTRTLVQALQACGVAYQGPYNQSLDYLPFTSLFKQKPYFKGDASATESWEVLRQILEGKTLSQAQQVYYAEQVEKSSVQSPAEAQLQQLPTEPQLFLKEPNVLHFLRDVNTHFPKSAVVLMLRYPLDMVQSANQQQFENWAALYGIKETSFDARLRFWVEVHKQADQCLRQAFAGRFLWVPYREVCTRPEYYLERILKLGAFEDYLPLKPKLLDDLFTYREKNHMEVLKTLAPKRVEEAEALYTRLCG